MTALVLALLAGSDLVLRGLDPVELRSGRQVPGRSELSAEHENYRYQFANDTNRARFLAEPGLFAVQIGGACGSMGPLSGRGRPDLFATVGGRTYLFASEACKRAVLANPGAYVDGPDPRPGWGTNTVEAGVAALEAVIRAHGGRKALEGLGGLVWQVRPSYQQGNETKHYTIADGFLAGGVWLHDEVYETGRYLSWTSSRGGWTRATETIPMAPSEGEFLRRRLLHHPVAVMAHAGRRGFLARRVDENTIDVWFEGSATRLETGPDGTVVSASYRDRGGRGYARFHRTFSDWRVVRGFLVPYAHQTVVGGQSAGSVQLHRVWAGVDAPADLPRR